MSAFGADNQLRLVLALAIALAGCGDDGVRQADRAPAGSESGASRRTKEAGGEVASESAKPALHWLNDANAVALVNLMNGRQLAAADAELSSWHVDTVRAFAAEMSREHSAMQHSIDSIADVLKLVPVTPALAPLVRARMQVPIDSMWQHAGRGFDRAYLDQAISGHQLMQLYLSRLSAAAQSPALQQVLSVASDSVQSQLKRATALRAAFAVADSAAADSAARRAARRAARLKGEADR